MLDKMWKVLNIVGLIATALTVICGIVMMFTNDDVMVGIIITVLGILGSKVTIDCIWHVDILQEED